MVRLPWSRVDACACRTAHLAETVGGVHVVVGTLRVVEAALLVVPAAQGADSVHRAACEMVLQLHEAPLLDSSDA